MHHAYIFSDVTDSRAWLEYGVCVPNKGEGRGEGALIEKQVIWGEDKWALSRPDNMFL